MKDSLIRCTEPGHRVAYVRSIGRDGGFSITYVREQARAFTQATARAHIARLPAVSRMSFDTCDAPEACHA